MPVYNGESFLIESIESILKQTFKNFEFIIINDGSTDSSLNIIRKYAAQDSRIQVIDRQNKGLVVSLNEGISLAKGKYIARMDADDISLPERLEQQFEYLENNPEITILGTYIEAFGNEGEEAELTNLWFNEKLISDNIHKKFSIGCPIAHPTVMMKTEFVKAEKYSYKYTIIEDYELWMRALKKGYKIANLDKVLLKYRVHNNSKSKLEKGRIKLKQRVACKLENFFDIKKRDVLVWGAGFGGEVFTDYIKNSEWRNKINILAVVDKTKEGYINGIEIIKPNEIGKMGYEFVFITSSLGYKKISSYLDGIGLKVLKDYIFAV